MRCQAKKYNNSNVKSTGFYSQFQDLAVNVMKEKYHMGS